jgi:hypothetical protein
MIIIIIIKNNAIFAHKRVAAVARGNIAPEIFPRNS